MNLGAFNFMKKKNQQLILLSFICLAVAVSFNNCGRGRYEGASSGTLNSQSLNTYNSATVCSEQDINVFDRGYHQFVSQTCKTCHVSGPGKGTFASPDLASAFSGFTMVGYDKLSQYAVSNSHNPPYTGTQNLELINSLRLQWQTYQVEKSKCDGAVAATPVSVVFTPKFETTSLNIPQIGFTTATVAVNGANVLVKTFDRKTLTWDLNSTLAGLSSLPVPSLNGAQLSLTVSGFETPSGETAYLFTLPLLKVGGQSLHVKGMNLRMNGFPISYATTFKGLDIIGYQNTTALLSPGSLVSVGALGSSDTVSVQFGSIELIAAAAPPPPPPIQFHTTSLTIMPDQLGSAHKVTIHLEVLGTNTNSILAPVNVVADSAYEAGEVPATGVLGIGQNRFDWDYKIDPTTSTSLILNPGQTTASFNLIFSDDLRHHSDRVLRLSLGTPLGASLGANQVLRISLPNYNSIYNGNAPTFAQLMNPKSGVLGVNCVKCHNSVQRQGGYDMTNYEDMKNRGIIIPGNLNVNQHKMFRRMNADDPNLQGLQSMPLDGFLPRDQVDLVNQWILDGARNN